MKVLVPSSSTKKNWMPWALILQMQIQSSNTHESLDWVCVITPGKYLSTIEQKPFFKHNTFDVPPWESNSNIEHIYLYNPQLTQSALDKPWNYGPDVEQCFITEQMQCMVSQHGFNSCSITVQSAFNPHNNVFNICSIVQLTLVFLHMNTSIPTATPELPVQCCN